MPHDVPDLDEITTLTESETCYRLLVQSVKDYAIFMLDPNGRIISWNAGAERIKGYKEQEILGNHISIFYTQKDNDRKYPQYELEVAACVGSYEDEGWRIRKNGTMFWADVVITALYDTNGKLSGYAKVTRDLTERKHAERTQRFAEKADAANKSKSEFLANMSHEIRTPMNSVIGSTELLLHTTLNAEQKELVEAVYSAGEVLLSLINDILDISKIEAGEMHLFPTPFDCSELIHETLKIFVPIAAEKKLHLTFDCSDNISAIILGDYLRLKQIFFNLLSNAIKFTDQGAVIFAVKKLHRTDTSITLRFEIIDSGIGIEPDKKALIFEKFMQVENFSTKKFGGTGLGLAICKQLVTLMNGVIGVTSEYGKGSRFWLEIPFLIATDSTLPLTHEALPVPTTAPHFKANILLVEDYPPNQIVAKKILEHLGCTISIAEDGEEALRMLQTNRYDIIFMDCQMPELDGFEATKRIRLNQKTAGNIIVAMTANALEGDKERCIAAGMDDYISKPIRSVEIETILTRYLPKSPLPIFKETCFSNAR